MSAVSNQHMSFTMFNNATNNLANKTVSESGIHKVVELWNATSLDKLSLGVKKSVTDFIDIQILSNVSFSHVLLGLIAIILSLAVFEKLFSRIFTHKIGHFFKKHYLFGVLYGLNWLFILLLAMSKYKYEINFKLRISFDEYKTFACVLGVTALVLLLGLTCLFILPTVFKYVVSSIPASLGGFYLYRYPGLSSGIVFAVLFVVSCLVFSYCDIYFKVVEVKASTTAKIILQNFIYIFIINVISCSIFYIQFSILKSLFLQAHKDTPYYFYIVFTFFWSSYVASYISSVFSFSLLAHSVAEQKKYDIKEYKVVRACKLVSQSFGCICFFASLPSIFESISHLLLKLDLFISKISSNFVTSCCCSVISFFAQIIKAIATVLYCYNIYSLVNISCYGIEYLDEDTKDENQNSQIPGFSYMQDFKSFSFVLPIFYFVYLYFFKSTTSIDSNAIAYTIFISYMMIENIFSLIEPTFQYIADGAFLKNEKCAFRSKDEFKKM